MGVDENLHQMRTRLSTCNAIRFQIKMRFGVGEFRRRLRRKELPAVKQVLEQLLKKILKEMRQGWLRYRCGEGCG